MQQRILLIVRVLFTGLSSFIVLAIPLYAQGENRLMAGEAQQIDLRANQPLYLLYTGEAGQTVNITTRSLEAGAVDTVLEVRLGNRRLAYSDNHPAPRGNLAVSDAAVYALRLLQAGEYTIRLDSYGSIDVGQVEVLLEVVDPFAAEVETSDEGVTVTATLLPRQPYTYALTAQAGERLTITARDLSHRLDLILRVRDSEGNVLLMNDDHGSSDLTLDAFDARIGAFAAPAAGDYSIVVTDALGRGGRFQLTLFSAIEP